jgi:hypothetical protein
MGALKIDVPARKPRQARATAAPATAVRRRLALAVSNARRLRAARVLALQSSAMRAA